MKKKTWSRKEGRGKGGGARSAERKERKDIIIRKKTKENKDNRRKARSHQTKSLACNLNPFILWVSEWHYGNNSVYI